MKRTLNIQKKGYERQSSDIAASSKLLKMES